MHSDWFWGGEVPDEDTQQRAIRWLRTVPLMEHSHEFLSGDARVATVLKVPTPWRGVGGIVQRDREVHFRGLSGTARSGAQTLDERLEYGFVFDRTRHGIIYSVLHVATLLDDDTLAAADRTKVRALADDGIDYIAAAGGHARTQREDIHVGVLLALFAARYCPMLDAGDDWGTYDGVQQTLMLSEHLPRLLDDGTNWEQAVSILTLEAAPASVSH